MNRNDFHRITLLSLLLLLGLACNINAQQVAFPGAEGFGRFARGGRGGDVYHVTNLYSGGSGSLKEGIESANGPRTIVFDVSGTISIHGGLEIDKPYITIAGQTAPGEGITLKGGALSVKANDIIVRYIRCRLGDQSGSDDDAVHVSSGFNIIFDHISTSWSIDETFSFQSGDIDMLTVQWCMVTESLRDSHHEKGMHGYGGIIGGLRQTVHHNLYAHHSSRSPKVSGRRHCEVDFRNNVIYNWKYNNCYDGTKSYLNWANNYYKAGPGTDDSKRHRIFKLSDASVDAENEGWEISNTYVTSLYADGNYVDGFPDITADNWSGGIDYNDGANEAANRVHTPHIFPTITEQTALEAYPLVLESAGASLVRDTIDKRIIHEVITGTTTYNGSKTGTPGIIDSQNDVGGWPELKSTQAPTDTDQDGMPDWWEEANGLDPNYQFDGIQDRNADGYTNLEEYLNDLISMPPLGIETQINKSGALPCYPNPTNAGFIIDLSDIGKADIKIFDPLGQLVYNSASTASFHKVNDHNLSTGIYFIKVRNKKNDLFTQKLLII